MNQNNVENLKGSIKQRLDAEVVYLNERTDAFERINKAYKSLSEKNVDVLIDRCNYRMGSLMNAHRYSSVANQEEIEKDTAELNQLVTELNNEAIDIENIGKEMGDSFEEPKYQEFANDIKSIIDSTLVICGETARKGTDCLSNKFDSFENQVEEEKVEAPAPVEEAKEEVEFTPTEIKTDSIDEIENQLNSELQPILDDKKELEETKNELEGAVQVTNIEPAPQAIVSPILPPSDNPDLNTFLSQGIQEEKVEAPRVEMNEIKSAPSVDEGPVLVTKVETFDLNETKENEGPVLSRTA